LPQEGHGPEVFVMAEDPEEIAELRERGDLAKQIAAAFADLPRPDPPITVGAGPLNEDIERAIAGKTADQITAAEAREVRHDLPYLSPAAFIYYLPALLRIILTDDTHVDGLDEFVFYQLAPPENLALSEHFTQRIGRLDDLQRDALRRYVDWYSASEPFLSGRDSALAYWHS
jgi:hypothetical protein